MAKETYNIGEETEQVEFKKSTGELKEGIISIASILNKHGSGELYFGVKNNGDVIGQQITDETMRDISQGIRNHLKPAIYPVIDKEHHGDKTIISVKFEGTEQPYLAYNIPRIRVADEDLVMEQPMYEKMMQKRDSIRYAWENQPSKYSVSDIDEKIFREYLNKAKEVGRISFENEDMKSVMTKLELSDGDRLLNAGAAIFVHSGVNELAMAKFASDRRITFTDMRREVGSILELSDMAVKYLIDAMDWRVEFHGKLERDEVPEVPVDALREAIINAFAHRRIESGQNVEVTVLRSYIDIASPGKFPDGVTPEEFVNEDKKPIRRNPLITRTLYYSKDMESFATGLKRIHDLCEEAGVKVEYIGDEYWFTVRFYRHCGEGWGENPDSKAPKHQGEALGEALEDALEEKVFDAIRKNSRIKQDELASKLSVSRATVQRICKVLTEKGIIERKGGKRYGYWEIHE